MARLKEKNIRLYDSSKNQTTSMAMEFNAIKVGKNLLSNDVTLDVDFFRRRDTRISKEKIERAIRFKEVETLRQVSNYYFEKSGIYSRLCTYIATLFRYDYFVTPVIYDKSISDAKVTEGWYKSCDLLESCHLKRNFGKIALKVIKNGCYYGYRIDKKDASYLQELPVKYCRSRYELNGRPAVEFNIKFFDDLFSDVDYRIRVLKMFPKEIQKAYVSYKKGTLPKDFNGDDTGWFLLDPSSTVKFNLNDSDIPIFISTIPALIDLEDAQDIDLQKMKQQLLKIIVQKMPLDKNGDLIFDVQEANALHKNAVNMLGNSIGVDVLTTFADVDEIDLSSTGTRADTDQLEKVERSVYNEFGSGQMLFNPDGNIALEYSIKNDGGIMTDLLLQFEEYAQSLLKPFNKSPKRLRYTVQILPTTIYNYTELAGIYKEMTMLGYSKLLPPVALGQPQTAVIASAYFENKIMKLDELFIAPQMSSTMSSNDKDADSSKETVKITSQNKGGRPELPNEKKTTKTIQNKESEG